MECGRQRWEIQTLLLQRNLRSGVFLPFFFFEKKKNKTPPDRWLAPTGFALRKFHVTDSQNTPDQIPRGTKVQTRVIKLRFVHSIHSPWKSKRMLTTYMQRMRNNNLETRIAVSSCRPQQCCYTCSNYELFD